MTSDERPEGSAVSVELIRWPAESARLEVLRERGVARLLLVDEDGIPPPVVDCLEDWVRVPAFERDILARTATVSARGDRHGGEAHPELDDSGILRYRGEWVSLGPVDAALASELLARFEGLVSRETLTSRAWPGVPSARNNLDVQIMRLRRRLAPLHLCIRTVRSRGYVLEPSRRAPVGV